MANTSKSAALPQRIYEELYQQYIHGNSDWNASWDKYGRELIAPNPNALRKKFQRMRISRGDRSLEDAENIAEQLEVDVDNIPENLPDDWVSSSVKELEDSINIVCDSVLIKTLPEVIKHFGIDTEVWKPISFEAKTQMAWRKDREVNWHVSEGVHQGDVRDSGKILVVPIVHTATKFQLREGDDLWTEKRILELFETLDSKSISLPNPLPNVEAAWETLIIPIADLHLGLLSTPFSNMGDEYNMDVAMKRVQVFVDEILSRTSLRKFSEIILTVGNDFLNTDNLDNATTKGTPQDSQAFWFEIMMNAELVLKWAIERCLTRTNKVSVINVVSNHDLHSMWSLMKLLDAYYGNEPRISIDVSADIRKYRRIGNTLACFTHTVKIEDARDHVMNEARENLDAERYVWLLAHLHRAMQFEARGRVDVYRLPTFSGHSRWSNRFVVAEKKGQAFVIDHFRGILDVMNVPF